VFGSVSLARSSAIAFMLLLGEMPMPRSEFKSWGKMSSLDLGPLGRLHSLDYSTCLTFAYTTH
jgi:hypothetical protein